MKTRIIMVTGPAGSGKTSSAVRAAEILTERGKPSLAVSSGWIYRVFAFIARDRNIPWKGDDCAGLVTYLRNLQIYITPDAEVIVDGVELLVEHLKTQEISELTSQIAQFPMVRELSQTVLNQTLGTLNVAYILIDGRDSDRSIYSLPVLCQIYMDVSFAEAAKRSGESLAEVMERDARDAKRLIEALQSSDIKFPTDSMTLEESAQTLVDHILSTPLP